MPKRVPEGAKRVPLNCLISPTTRHLFASMKCSQGEAVDHWAATWRMAQAQGRVIPAPVLDGIANQGRGNQDPDVPLSKVVTKELKRQSQTWKRGPRPKGDKTR